METERVESPTQYITEPVADILGGVLFMHHKELWIKQSGCEYAMCVRTGDLGLFNADEVGTLVHCDPLKWWPRPTSEL